MSKREWKPGDVASILPKGTQVALRTRAGWTYADGSTHGVRADEYNFRPLVVIDLPPGALAGWPVLVNALREAGEKTGYRMIFDGLIEQIETQTKPPKPEEPTGLGAVVEDADGRLFTRRCDCGAPRDWWPNHAIEEVAVGTAYSDIDAVRVLSEGVQP
jgi:hypothetical protein